MEGALEIREVRSSLRLVWNALLLGLESTDKHLWKIEEESLLLVLIVRKKRRKKCTWWNMNLKVSMLENSLDWEEDEKG